MSFESLFNQRLDGIRQEGRFRELQTSQGVSFISSDGLGLSRHPHVLAAAREAVDIFGAGSTGSRLLGGQNRLFASVEASIADYFKAPSALLFSTGYLANQALIQVLAGSVDIVCSDELNHASLIDGIRLTQKPKKIFPHREVSPLDEVSTSQRPLVVTESLFSMDGDIAPLEELVRWVEVREGFLIVDEAHAAGVFPETGRGFLSQTTFDWSRTAVVVTFGKAFGASGAAVLCSPALRELLINEGRAFIYSTAGAPAAAGAVQGALEVLKDEPWRREALWARCEQVRDILSEIPYVRGQSGVPAPGSVWEKRVPIVPVFTGSSERALSFAQNMRDLGVELRAIRYPTVKKGQERLRISIGLGVSEDNTLEMAQQLVTQWKEFSLPEPAPA